MTKKKPAARKGKKQRKIFVLDTSVILYDHNAIKNFEENDIAIPIQVLEELDNFKKGNETRNFEAREFIRFIDEISGDDLLDEWISLNGPTKGKFKVIMGSDDLDTNAEEIFGDGKYDHRILNAAMSLQKEYKDAKVVLVSKDICLRLKAKSLKLKAEDYETGKIKDVRQLYTGKSIVDGAPEKMIDTIFEKGEADAKIPGVSEIAANSFMILRNGKKSSLCTYDPIMDKIKRVDKHTAYKVQPRNAEQTFAFHALMNPAIKLITIQGVAGTGKTLLALAAAIEQRSDYRQIYVARPVIPLSNKDIGFLPGDIKSKLDPYMQPIWDNLKFIKDQYKQTDKAYKVIEDMVQSEKIAIAPLAYIRGRSLSKVFFIVDEAQNLTPHEVKTIISRAGDDTKIVFTGDIYQIDTPYLDAESNGLSYLIDRVKNNSLFAHITLEKGERSDLANLANELL